MEISLKKSSRKLNEFNNAVSNIIQMLQSCNCSF